MLKLSGNQKGLAQLYIIIAVIVVLAGGGPLPTKQLRITPNSPTTPAAKAQTATVASACLKAYNDSNLCAFANHTNIASQQYVAIGTATTGSGTSSTFTVSNDGKGNTEVTYGSNGQEVSSISLDGVTYVQEGTGTTWLEYSSGAVGATAFPTQPVASTLILIVQLRLE